MNDLVYRAGRNGKVWHWRNENRAALMSACGWDFPIVDGASTTALSVRIEDRCTARACGIRWKAWLRATIHAALVDAANRNAA